VTQPGVVGGGIWDVTKRRTRRRVLWPRNLASRGREGRRSARASGGRLSGSGRISDTMRGAFERVWIPGQQAGVVVALGGLLGIFIDYLCGHTLESTRSGLGGVALDAGLGLAVDEGGDGGELGVVGVVDGLDAVLDAQLVDRERRASGGGHGDAFGPGWLGGMHERKRKGSGGNERPCLEHPLPLRAAATRRFQP